MRADIYIYIYIIIIDYWSSFFRGVDVVEWSRALDVRISEWCCSVSMVWVQIPSREEQKIWQLKDLILTLFGLIFRRIYIKYIYFYSCKRLILHNDFEHIRKKEMLSIYKSRYGNKTKRNQSTTYIYYCTRHVYHYDLSVVSTIFWQ